MTVSMVKRNSVLLCKDFSKYDWNYEFALCTSVQSLYDYMNFVQKNCLTWRIHCEDVMIDKNICESLHFLSWSDIITEIYEWKIVWYTQDMLRDEK
jgi:hypothetical protein